MKAYYSVSKFLKAMSLIAMTLVLANCGKSDGGGGSNNANSYVANNQCYINGAVQTALSACQSVAGTYYGYVGNQCYQVGAGVYQVAPSYSSCTNSTGGYYYQNGLCYQNGQQVNAQLCATNSTGGGVQICNGMQLYGAQYDGQPATIAVNCQEGASPYYTNGVMDCSGLRLSTTYGSYYPNITCQ